MSSRRLGLALAACAVVMGLLWIATESTAARALLALVALAVPGYLLTAALFAPGQLRGPEWVVLSLGGSLLVAVVGGLVLNATPWGLQPGAWLVLLAGVALVLGSGAWRRQRSTVSTMESPEGLVARATLEQAQAAMAAGRWDLAAEQLEHLAAREGAPARVFDGRQVLALVLAALLVGTAVTVARAGAIAAPTPGFTQLWLVPAAVGEPATLRLGVRSAEREVTRYALRLEQGDTLLAAWPALEVAPGGTWEITVRLPLAVADGPVTAVLARAETPDVPYRWVTWWPRSRGE